jgi:creatinine amidohydrolase
VTTDPRAVRAELLLPHQLTAALAARPVAYLPLGSIEFHGAHLPIGLDALTAHGVCLRAAARDGGIVLPPLYYGVGGGHTGYPWTIMAGSAASVRALLRDALRRLADFGVTTAVLFTGHFSDEQLDLVDEVAAEWHRADPGMRVLALSVNRAGTRTAPDHAGLFETSLLSALHPELVQLQRLPSLERAPSVDPGGDVSGAHRHDAGHPLHGVFGPDPRTFDPGRAGELLEEIVTWLIGHVARVHPTGSEKP